MSRVRTPLRKMPAGVRGMTLVELMVAIAIGMLIMTAMALLFASNSRTRVETERASQKIENGRYGLEVISTELQHAGFYSVFDPRKFTLPASKPNACATDLATLATALGVHVQGENDVTSSILTSSLSCLSDVKVGTDVVVIRRAAGCAVGAADCTSLATGAPAFQASSCNTQLATGVVSDGYRFSATTTDFTMKKRDCLTDAEYYRYLVRIYYVANNDKSGDGIPTLKRIELGAAGWGTALSLVQGVEDLQLEYGLDTALPAGNPDVYTTSPDTSPACAGAVCVENWASTVAVKVYLLSRNIVASAGHTDAKTYVLGSKSVGPLGDGYKRSVFQEVVRLNNVSARRATP